MRRNEEREAALDAILTEYRETCWRIRCDEHAGASRLAILSRHKGARDKARSEIFRVMRRDKRVKK